MSGRIALANGAIAGARNQFIFMDQNRSNGNFSGNRCGARFFESLLHELKVGIHPGQRIADNTLFAPGLALHGPSANFHRAKDLPVAALTLTSSNPTDGDL